MTEEVTATLIPANGKIDLPKVDEAAGEYRILRLLPSDPFTRKLIPAFIDRCLGFIERTNSDTDELWLIHIISSNFYQNTNHIHCLVVLDKNEKIVGHNFAYVEFIQKLGPHIHVLQTEKDEGGVDLMYAGYDLVVEWGRSLGIKLMINSVGTDSRARYFHQKGGWELHRIVMKKSI